jgi:diguanylate cyclase (GGDEF)-like protein
MSSERPDKACKLARIAGLNSFEFPSLKGVEHRRLQLWTVAIFLLIVLGLTLDLVLLFPQLLLPDWLPPRVIQGGLLGMLLLFGGYAIEKERTLRHLSQLLIDEKVLSASLSASLREVSALLEAGKAINLNLNLEEVLRRIVDCAFDLLDSHDASLMLVHAQDRLRTVCVAGNSGARSVRLRFGEGIAGQVAVSREPVLVTGILTRPPRHGDRSEVPPSPASAMSVPLLHRDELLGVLNVNAKNNRVYSEHDLRALSLFSEQAAAAIAHAKLLESQRLTSSFNRYQALHDHLTGLPNRGLFLDRVTQSLRHRRPESSRVAVAYLDLDDFKLVNDDLGHEAGDRLLVAYADRLRRAVREGDTVARFGGDEFALLLGEIADVREARASAERLLAITRESMTLGEREIVLQASIGLAMAEDGKSDPASLLLHADLALRSAKTSGKGRVEIFQPAMEDAAVAAEELSSALPLALERGELEVHYQPIVLLASGCVVGVEALVRWRHPGRGLLPATVFVPFAKQIGLISEIDRRILVQACHTVARLPQVDGTVRPLALFLHLEAVQLHDPNLPQEIATTFVASGLTPDQLHLELPDDPLFTDLDAVLPHLRGLKEIGIHLALSDFGTGPAATTSLHKLGVDTVKINRLVVSSLDRDGAERALIQAVLNVATTLDLEVVAEGVEREAQREALLDLGCGAAQGMLFAPPMPADELVSYLATSSNGFGKP